MPAYLTMLEVTLCARHSPAYGTRITNPTLTLYMYCRRCLDTRVSNPPYTICVAKEESRKFAGTMEEVFATATNDANTTYDTTSATTDSCENEVCNNDDVAIDTDITNVEEDSYTGNVQDLRYHDTYEKQYTSLFPVGHAPTNFATPTKVGMSHQARSSHKHITNTNTKLPNYIKLTRNNNVSPFPCGYNDHKLIVGHNSMATSKLG